MKKDDTMLIKINKEQKKIFIDICNKMDTSASREVRNFIKKFIEQNSKDV